YLREHPNISISFISGANENRMRGVRLHTYREPGGEHWTAMRERGLAVHRIITRLHEQGERFDAVLAHMPFGDGLYLRTVLPTTPAVAPSGFLPPPPREHVRVLA